MIPGGIDKVGPDAKAGNNPPAEEPSVGSHKGSAQPISGEQGAFDRSHFAALTQGIQSGLAPSLLVHASRPGSKGKPKGFELTEDQRKLIHAYFERLYELYNPDNFVHTNPEVVTQQLEEFGNLQGPVAEEFKYWLDDITAEEEDEHWPEDLAFVRISISASTAALAPAADPIEEILYHGITDEAQLPMSLSFLLRELSHIFNTTRMGDGHSLTETIPITISDDLPEGVEGSATLPRINTISPHSERAESITLRSKTSIATLAHELTHAVKDRDLTPSLPQDFFVTLDNKMSLAETYDRTLFNLLLDEAFATSVEVHLLSRIEQRYKGALHRGGFSEYDRHVLDRFRDHVEGDISELVKEANLWLEVHAGYFSYRFAAFVRSLFFKAGVEDEAPCLEDLISLAGFGNAREHEFGVDAEKFGNFIRDSILPHLKAFDDNPIEWVEKIKTSTAISSINVARIIRFLRGQMGEEEIAEFLSKDFGRFVQIASEAIEAAEKAKLVKTMGVTQKLKPRTAPMQPGDIAGVSSRPEPAADAIEAMAKFTEVLFEMGDSIFSSSDVPVDKYNPRLSALIYFALKADSKSSARAFDMMISALDQHEMPMYEQTRITKALLDAGYEQAGMLIIESLKLTLREDYSRTFDEGWNEDWKKSYAIFETIAALGDRAQLMDKEIADIAMSRFGEEETLGDDNELAFSLKLLDSIADETFERMPHTKKVFKRIVNMIDIEYHNKQRYLSTATLSSKRTLTWLIEKTPQRLLSGKGDTDLLSYIVSSPHLEGKAADAIFNLYLTLPAEQRRKLLTSWEVTEDGELIGKFNPLDFWHNLHGHLSEDTAIAILEMGRGSDALHTNFIIYKVVKALLNPTRTDREVLAHDILTRIHIPTKASSRYSQSHIDDPSLENSHDDSADMDSLNCAAYALHRISLYALAQGDERMLAEAVSKLKMIEGLSFKIGGTVLVISTRIPRLKANLQVLTGTDARATQRLLAEIENDVALGRGSYSNLEIILEHVSFIAYLRGSHEMDQTLMRLGRAYIDQCITAGGSYYRLGFSGTLETVHAIPIPDYKRDDLFSYLIERVVPRIQLFRLADIKALPKLVSDAGIVLKNRHLYPKSEALLLEKIRKAVRDVRPFPDMELNATLVSALLPLWNAYADAAHLDPARRDKLAALRADPEYQQALDMLRIFTGEHQKIDRTKLLKRYSKAVQIRDAAEIGKITRPLRDETSSELRDKLIGQRNGFDKLEELVDRRIPKRDEVVDTLLERLYLDWLNALEKGNKPFADSLLYAWAVATERSDARQRAPILLEALSKDIVPVEAKRAIAQQLFRTGEYDAGFINAYEMAVNQKDSEKEGILQRLMQPIHEKNRISFPRTTLAAFVMDSDAKQGLEFAEHYERMLKSQAQRGHADITPQGVLWQAMLWHNFTAVRSTPNIAFRAWSAGIKRRDLSQYLMQNYVSLSLARHMLATGKGLPSTGDDKLKMSPKMRRLVAQIAQNAESIAKGWGDSAEKYASEIATYQISKKISEGASLADYDRVLEEFPNITERALRAEDQALVLELGEVEQLKDRDRLTRHLVQRFLVQLPHGERQGIALGMEGTSKEEANRVFFERSGLEKIGQFLSYWPQVPAEIRKELRHLQAHVAPTPTALVRDFIDQSLGDHPEKEAMLANLSYAPIASGTIGETYESRLSNGKRVAFEKGIKLARECEGKLTEAKGKIEKLITDSQGNIKTKNFEVK